MNRFTIKDVENLSGIKAHTWRIWEQRYNIGIPQRKDSNHRVYDSETLKQILRISYLYHKGVKASKIARLPVDEINELALKPFSGNGKEYYIKEMLEASLDFDEERFERNFADALNAFGLNETILKIIYPYQERIGMLWLTDHVVPAQEHFTSNLIRQKILAAIDSLPPIPIDQGRRIALFTPENEQHEIPLLFIHYLLKKNGGQITYFGKNVSLKSVQEYDTTKPFTHLMFHLVTNLTSKNADDYLRLVSEMFADREIIMSGTQVQSIKNVPKNVRLLHSMEELLQFANYLYAEKN